MGTFQIHRQRESLLAMTHGSSFKLPAKSVYLNARIEQGQLSIWYEVDADERTPELYLFWTGQDIPMADNLNLLYLTTMKDEDITGLVWHLYIKDQ